MERAARLADAQRRELFSETAARLGMTPAVAEKDFWVTWVLARLFDAPELARVLMFKGGTSLSKAYGLIERFSEDIDLILDWRVLVADNPRAERSRTRQQRLNEQINLQASAYVANTLFAQVQATVGGVCRCAIAHDDPFVIEVQYPAAFADDYLRPEVRLVPDGEVLAEVAADYRAMEVMIFGNIPEFDEMMARLQALEDEINGSAHAAHRPA